MERRWGDCRLDSLPLPFPETSIDADGKGYKGVKIRREVPDRQLILDALGERMIESVKERGGVPASLCRYGAELDGVVCNGPPTL